jgi:hypothetical protein
MQAEATVNAIEENSVMCGLNIKLMNAVIARLGNINVARGLKILFQKRKEN